MFPGISCTEVAPTLVLNVFMFCVSCVLVVLWTFLAAFPAAVRGPRDYELEISGLGLLPDGDKRSSFSR